MALWDVSTGQQLQEYEAHKKRIWTVDFCHSDPMHFISGSDDGWVKVRCQLSLLCCCPAGSEKCPTRSCIPLPGIMRSFWAQK